MSSGRETTVDCVKELLRELEAAPNPKARYYQWLEDFTKRPEANAKPWLLPAVVLMVELFFRARGLPVNEEALHVSVGVLVGLHESKWEREHAERDAVARPRGEWFSMPDGERVYVTSAAGREPFQMVVRDRSRWN